MNTRSLLAISLLGIAVTVAALSILSRDQGPSKMASTDAGGAATSAGSAATPVRTAEPFSVTRAPRVAIELFVLSSAKPGDVEVWLDREKAAGKLSATLCGDEDTCALVRSYIRESERVSVTIVPRGQFPMPSPDTLARQAEGLSKAERGRLQASQSVLSIRVQGAPDPDQLPARAALALAAEISASLSGFVFDPVRARFERPSRAASRVLRAGREALELRRDNFDLQFERTESGITRVRTLGLSHFGAPDIEVVGPHLDKERGVRNLLLHVAQSLVFDEVRSPFFLDGHELTFEATTERRAGEPDSPLIHMRLARGSDEQAWQFVAATFADDPTTDTFDELEFEAIRIAAKELFGEARERHLSAPGSRLEVELPATAGSTDRSDSVWVLVQRVDDRSVSGIVTEASGREDGPKVDDPITRPIGDLLDYRLEFADGTVEMPGG